MSVLATLLDCPAAGIARRTGVERFVRLPSLLLIAALCAGCGGSEEMTSASPPNVLLIVVDSLRADHLSAYGYTRETSPFLDRFAQRGTRFAQAYTHSSQTKLSVASILTGLTPPSHGLRSALLMSHKTTVCQIGRKTGKIATVRTVEVVTTYDLPNRWTPDRYRVTCGRIAQPGSPRTTCPS